MMKAEYKRDFTNSYLILPMLESHDLEEFQIKIMQEKKIPGIMNCQIGTHNNESFFYYEISGKNHLKKTFELKKIKYAQLKNMFLQIRDIFNRAHEFLLDEKILLLESEFIYLDIRELIVYLIPYPDYEKTTRELLGNFSEFLLDIVDYDDEKAIELVYDFYEFSKEDNFTWSTFINFLDRKESKMKVFDSKKIVEEFQNETTQLNESVNETMVKEESLKETVKKESLLSEKTTNENWGIKKLKNSPEKYDINQVNRDQVNRDQVNRDRFPEFHAKKNLISKKTGNNRNADETSIGMIEKRNQKLISYGIVIVLMIGLMISAFLYFSYYVTLRLLCILMAFIFLYLFYRKNKIQLLIYDEDMENDI